MEKKSEVYSLAVTAMMAAVTAAVAPFAVPIGPIPITLCTLSLYLSAYVLEWKRRHSHLYLSPFGCGWDACIQRISRRSGCGGWTDRGIHCGIHPPNSAVCPGRQACPQGTRAPLPRYVFCHRCTLCAGHSLVLPSVWHSVGCGAADLRADFYPR